jgi:hypothetical protein
MNDEKPDKARKRKDGHLEPQEIEAACMVQMGREAVETVGADAVLIVWTKQRKRRTSIHSISLGNQLTVQGLMRWVRDRIDEIEDADEKDEEEDEDEEDD